MKSGIAVFVIALYIFLPLYEFVDCNEQWPNDGHFVAVIFTILFIVEIPRILRKADSLIIMIFQSILRFALDPCPTIPPDRAALPACTGTALFLRLCDLRI